MGFDINNHNMSQNKLNVGKPKLNMSRQILYS